MFSSFHVRGSLTIQRIFSKGPLFQVGYLAFNHTSLQIQKWTNIQGGGGSFEIGWGILFRPLKKVSVSLRQGFALEGYEEYHVELLYWVTGHIVRDTDTLTPRMQKARLWVLIHF